MDGGLFLQNYAAKNPIADKLVSQPSQLGDYRQHSAEQAAEFEAIALANYFVARGELSAETAEKLLKSLPAGMSFGQFLMLEGGARETQIINALCDLYQADIADFETHDVSKELAGALPAQIAIETQSIIWRRAGNAWVVATSQPAQLARIASELPPGANILLAIAPAKQIDQALFTLYGPQLARQAEGRAPKESSCRDWQGSALAIWAVGSVAALLGLYLVSPPLVVALVFGLALLVFILNTSLKFLAFAKTKRHEETKLTLAEEGRVDWPMISLIVPLFQETQVVRALVQRLQELDYPRTALDVILAVEEADTAMLEAIEEIEFPPFIRTLVVPDGTPRTKPRALNYTLNFVRGDIIGIYDAEDRPDAQQLKAIATAFDHAPANVACLQGRLDYYNTQHNWMAAMFTVEYASWFRVILSGVEKLGLVVPLGGTTLFIKRDVLEEVGGWDAHNVTEDAELGLRLARSGYAVQLVDTVTFEEANAAVGPWIKQRSRWLKGYLMTWGTAMREPRELLADLGTKRFFWFQIQFLGSVAGFLLAPLLWSLLVKVFGAWHPVDLLLGQAAYSIIAMCLFLGMVGSVVVSVYACRALHLRRLRFCAPLVELYLFLGTAAAWVAAFEIVTRPFSWAKTVHGGFGGADCTMEDRPCDIEPVKASTSRSLLSGAP